MIHDYLHAHPDELRHWREVVRREAGRAADAHGAAVVLERELRRYHEERAAVAEPFRGVALREGPPRTSLRNLAELLIRLWAADALKPADPEAPPRLPYA